MTTNPDNVWFDKKHGNNECYVHATKAGCGKTKDPAVQEDEWDLWGLGKALHMHVSETMRTRMGWWFIKWAM